MRHRLAAHAVVLLVASPAWLGADPSAASPPFPIWPVPREARVQDERLLLYPGRNRTIQKFLLSQMEEIPLTFDSEELAETLDSFISDAARVTPGVMSLVYAIAAIWTELAPIPWTPALCC